MQVQLASIKLKRKTKFNPIPMQVGKRSISVQQENESPTINIKRTMSQKSSQDPGSNRSPKLKKFNIAEEKIDLLEQNKQIETNVHKFNVYKSKMKAMVDQQNYVSESENSEDSQ